MQVNGVANQRLAEWDSFDEYQVYIWGMSADERKVLSMHLVYWDLQLDMIEMEVNK